MSTGKDQSVSLTATCSDSEIVLHFGAPGSYRIWRKLPHETSWGTPIWERPVGDEFVDQSLIQPGIAWEYKVHEFNTGATGYILAGSKIPMVDNRGKLVMIVERTHAEALKFELVQFLHDLVSEGWEVLRRDVSRTDSPESVKAIIKAEYDADPGNVKTVLLFGAIPVFHSGFYSYDGHDPVIVAADTYFGEMLGNWMAKPSILPGRLQLSVGRIDFSNLTCYSNKQTNPRSERDLLRQYLNRNHAWRTGQWPVTPRGAIRDGFTDKDSSRDFAWNGWGNIPQLCRDGIEEILDGQFFTTATVKDYLTVHLSGGGQLTSMAGTGGSDDFALNEIKTPFVMLLGSAMLGRWDVESGFVRSALASGDDEKGCLCAFGAGAPHVFLHGMGLGGTIGKSVLLSENNFTGYPPTGNVEPGLYTPSESTGIPSCMARVHQSLHGDPTLTLFPVKPVTNFSGAIVAGKLHLTWTRTLDDSYGYRVYRSASANGPFGLVIETINPFAFIADHFPGLVYQVRAVKLVETPSGSYFGLSCGVFWTDSQTPPMPPTPGTIMSRATFITMDPATQGSWIGIYGKDGYYLASGPQIPAVYAMPQPFQRIDYIWSEDSQDERAIDIPGRSGRLAAVWCADIGFTVEIKSDALPHRLALYCLDWDRAGRMQRVEILDGATGAVLDSREMDDFGDGEYLVYDFQGSVKLRLTRLTGPNCVLSGIFFSAPGSIPTPAPAPGATRTLDVLCSTDGGNTWRLVQTTEIDATGTGAALFKLAIR